MDFAYVPGRILQYTTGCDWTSATLKALLVMTNTTAHQDLRATFLTGGSGFTALDEFDGAGYSRQTLANVTITDDVTSPLGDLIFDCDPIDFGATIANGSRQIKGVVIYLDGANDGARRPLLWRDSVRTGLTFPYSPAGGPVRVVTNPVHGIFRQRSRSAAP